MTVAVKAFAKINLSLRVKAKRADGFHEVQTILQAIDLADRLAFRVRRGPFAIKGATAGMPADRTNLVWKAAQQLWNAAGREGEPRDAVVTFDKQIPMRAGLGGGSSDAAAALLALRKLWKIAVTNEALLAIARRLGSDVPYFLVGGTALGLGRGDEVYPLADLPRWWAVLVFPPFGVSTAEAYQWLDEHRARTSAPPDERSLPNTWVGSVVPLVNDLEAPVVERHPAIGTLIARLVRLGGVMAAMSGSGSTVFGIFTTSRAAARAAGALRKSGAHVRVVRFIGRPR